MIIVTPVKFAPLILDIIEKSDHAFTVPGESVRTISTLDELNLIEGIEGQCLICFNTGVIIPKSMLASIGRDAYNFHAAPPEFPGRDPHHWAIHRGAKRYGATCHVMTDKVDNGPIIAVSRFDILPGTTAESLATQAIGVAAVLFENTFPLLLEGNLSTGKFEWGPIKTTREDSVRMRGKKGFENF